mmetsp:Transcript_51321/g.155984  ORF Transcript_51321/g.155984 Transcript_51321/m.155984 type:complete len:208 (+) Transcript_51321:523-1146(+)
MDLENAPNARQIVRRMPWRHQHQNVTDSCHAAAEFFLKLFKADRHAACRGLSNTVLVDAKTTHPHVRSCRLKATSIAVGLQGADYGVNAITPCVAEHELGHTNVILTVYAIHIRSALASVPRTHNVLADRADDRRLDLIDSCARTDAALIQILEQGGGQVVNAHCAQRMPKASVVAPWPSATSAEHGKWTPAPVLAPILLGSKWPRT